jgi:hypothetical protein
MLGSIFNEPHRCAAVLATAGDRLGHLWTESTQHTRLSYLEFTLVL